MSDSLTTVQSVRNNAHRLGRVVSFALACDVVMNFCAACCREQYSDSNIAVPVFSKAVQPVRNYAFCHGFVSDQSGMVISFSSCANYSSYSAIDMWVLLCCRVSHSKMFLNIGWISNESHILLPLRVFDSLGNFGKFLST